MRFGKWVTCALEKDILAFSFGLSFFTSSEEMGATSCTILEIEKESTGTGETWRRGLGSWKPIYEWESALLLP